MKAWHITLLLAIAGLPFCAGCVGGRLLDPSAAGILDDQRQPRPYPAKSQRSAQAAIPKTSERAEVVGTGVSKSEASQAPSPKPAAVEEAKKPASNEVTIANRHEHIGDQRNVLNIPPSRIGTSANTTAEPAAAPPMSQAVVAPPLTTAAHAVEPSPAVTVASADATPVAPIEPPKIELPEPTPVVRLPAVKTEPEKTPAAAKPATQEEQPGPPAVVEAPAAPKTADELLPEDAEERLEWLRMQYLRTFEELVRETRQAGKKEEASRLDQQLRLAYLLADDMNEAARAVDSLPEAEREAYKQLLFGLGQFVGEEDARRPAHRNARVAKALRDAIRELSPASRLELKNLTFCERVEQFGWYTEFRRPEFAPKQQVILYVEVDNVTADEKGQHNFETELAGSYQVFDSAGNLAAERTLPLDKETCRNYRRDYFLAYRIFIPEDLGPGLYRLELTIEDMKAKRSGNRKLGEATTEFRVRP